MNTGEFNNTLHELCSRLVGAFPDSQDIGRACTVLDAMVLADSGLPAKTFASKMKPFVVYLKTRDESFLDGPDSPLHFLGLYAQWQTMHAITRTIVMDYIVLLTKAAGLTIAEPCPAQDPLVAAMADMVNPDFIGNILNVAHAATLNMTEVDAKAMLAGQNHEKLGALCFAIMDSLGVQSK